MNLTVSSTALAHGVSTVSKAMANNSTRPILGGILLTVGDGSLTLQATDGDMAARHVMPATVEGGGSTVVSGKLLTGIVRNLPDAPVEIAMGGTALTLRCGRSRYTLHALDAGDFPTFPEVDPEQSMGISSASFAAMFDRVRRAASKDLSRPVLTGVWVRAEDGRLTLAATDSYRMSTCETSVDDVTFDAVIPVSVMQLAVANATDVMTISASESQVVFDCGRTTYVSRRIEGAFPDIKMLMPRSCGTRVSLCPQDMAQALKRVEAMASANPSVRIDAGGDELTLFASSPENGDATETVSAGVEGEPLTVAVNHRYLVDGMGVPDGEMVMEANGPTQPVLLRTYGEFDYVYLLMPVRM